MLGLKTLIATVVMMAAVGGCDRAFDLTSNVHLKLFEVFKSSGPGDTGAIAGFIQSNTIGVNEMQPIYVLYFSEPLKNATKPTWIRSMSTSESVGFDSNSLRGDGEFQVDDLTISMALQCTYSEDFKPMTGVLTVEGQQFDLANGRVLTYSVVDGTPAVTQWSDVTLPQTMNSSDARGLLMRVVDDHPQLKEAVETSASQTG